MEKRRVRLEINGVVCGLITQESDEYMRSLANELEEKLMEVQLASPYITREAAALSGTRVMVDSIPESSCRTGWTSWKWRPRFGMRSGPIWFKTAPTQRPGPA